MGDDCYNCWGCHLVSVSKNKASSSFSRCDSALDVEGEKDLRPLREMISNTFQNKFILLKVMSCGSDANMHAIMAATHGDTNRCLVAAGSYIAGDDGPLQCWSTTTLDLQEGVSYITQPALINNQFTQRQTIALPYCIPGMLDLKCQKEFEYKCMNALHIRCLLAKMKDRPFTCIILELMLAGNGASLSDRALEMLGRLAKLHGIIFIIDEIMTAGRTGKMLMLEGKPAVFTKRVTHVTLGKWFRAGLVLTTPTAKLDIAISTGTLAIDHTSRRGASTSTVDCKLVLRIWAEALLQIQNCFIRRQMVLKKLKVKEDDTWGTGTLIFAPVRRYGMIHGLKNRLLPMLEINHPIESIQCTKSPNWSKQAVNNSTVATVNEWVDATNYIEDCDNDYLKLIHFLIRKRNENDRIHSLKCIQLALYPGYTRNVVGKLLHKAEKKKLLENKMMGVKRCRVWYITNVCDQNNFLI